MIAARVANALALDYPRELLEVIVACDGCADATAARAREAGADLVLELPRGGKIRAQDAGVRTRKRRDRRVLRRERAVGAGCRACSRRRVRRSRASATPAGRSVLCRPPRAAEAVNQEGVYWRYELAVRAYESRLSSITAGNGAIYATRRDSYIVVDPIMGHDLSLPFNMVKRGLRAVYVPTARASEKMVPSLGGEFARKRRMMSHTWPILAARRAALPARLPARLRADAPLATGCCATSRRSCTCSRSPRTSRWWRSAPARCMRSRSRCSSRCCIGALLGGALRVRPLLIARYYVLTTASPAAGLWDWLRHGT